VRRPLPWRAVTIAITAWVLLLVVARVWGLWVVEANPEIGVKAVPLSGRWRWQADVRILPAIGLGVAAVAAGPALARRLPWPAVPALAGTFATVWALALAASEGWGRVSGSLDTRFDYLPLARRIEDPVEFIRTFVERVPELPTHPSSHPPGATLTFWAWEHVTPGGPGWAAALVLLGWGLAAAMALVLVRTVAGEGAARAAAPFLTTAPGAIWASSADALFAGVFATGAALVGLAVAGAPHPRWRDGLAVAGGVVLGLALHLSYGLVPLLAVPGAVILWRRAWRSLALASVGAGAVTVVFVAGGFWWFAGLAAARVEYFDGLGSIRPYTYFTLAGNPGALGIVLGPAVAAGLAVALRRGVPSSMWLLPGAGLAALLVADLSGLSKAEVERIWLPFAPFVASAVAALVVRRPTWWARAWLTAQVALVLLLQSWLASPW